MIDAHSRLFSSKVGILVSTGLPSKVFRKVTHCIFDMDGTLLDSEFVYHKMIHAICEKYGRNYSKEMERKFVGGTDREICLAVVKELKMPISADEMENQLTNISSKMLPHSPLMAGAERLLRHLHDYKVPLALATNSTEQAVRLHVVTKPAFFGMFNHKVSVTDPGVLRGKPHPDLYLLAASKFQDKPKPAKCLVFEDSEKGVLAAKEAGMQVVMIPDAKIDREKTRNATLIIRSLLDFQPELFGLPPFDGTKGDKKMPIPTKPDGIKVLDTELHKTKQVDVKSNQDVPEKSMIEREERRRIIYESVIERKSNKAPDTELPKTKQFEVRSSKDGFKKSMIDSEGGRISVDESIIERKSIRLSVIDKFVGRTVMQERTDLDKQPRGISFIDKLLERKDTEKGVENEDKKPNRISDERKSKSIPERLGNRKVSISEGPYERKIITFEPEKPIENSMEAQHGRKSLLEGIERKNQRISVENKTPKNVEDQRKGAVDRRREKSKKEEKAIKRISIGSKA